MLTSLRARCLVSVLAVCACSANQSAPITGGGGVLGGTAGDSSLGGGGSASAGTALGGADRGGVGGEPLPAHGLTARPANGECRITWTDPRSPPTSLKATGCFDVADPLKPAAALIPYTVMSPLWSDGAEKDRFMLIPDGQQITLKDCQATPEQCPSVCTPGLACEMEGEFQFPLGTILVKNFSLAGRRVETRLLVRFSQEEWFGHSYKWREDLSDADLVDRLGEDHTFQVAGVPQVWHYPSGAECMQCHTTAAGAALGTESFQLNGDYAYPNGVRGNQLTTLEKIGLFASPVPDRLKAVALPTYDDAAVGLEARARAYLHSNCSMCHRPGSNKPTVDFRFTTPLGATGACNADSGVQDGTLGIAGAKIIAPGAHSQSLVWVRMDTLEVSVRMPQIGTLIKDEQGSQLVADWIDALEPADCTQ